MWGEAGARVSVRTSTVRRDKWALRWYVHLMIREPAGTCDTTHPRVPPRRSGHESPRGKREANRTISPASSLQSNARIAIAICAPAAKRGSRLCGGRRPRCDAVGDRFGTFPANGRLHRVIGATRPCCRRRRRTSAHQFAPAEAGRARPALAVGRRRRPSYACPCADAAATRCVRHRTAVERARRGR